MRRCLRCGRPVNACIAVREHCGLCALFVDDAYLRQLPTIEGQGDAALQRQ